MTVVTTNAPQIPVDTARVTGCRELHFGMIDDALADVPQLVAAERAGKLNRLGNWTLGQTLGHLAAWINFGFDGNPLNPPWFVKVLSRMMKKRFIYGKPMRGFKIPKVPGGTLATELLSTDEGERRFRDAMERLRRGPPARPNPVFGALTHDEWINLHLRHAELHLGFLCPQSS
jgi:hypothetical protein